jgi:glycosyltransferase involved in cell wall biosynthesis
MITDVTIVTRTRNESNDLLVLNKVLSFQSLQPVEVIVVDNDSTDSSVLVAKELGYRVLSTSDYIPGKALNLGINAAQTDFVAVISSHCIPADENWLNQLVSGFVLDADIAGVYGRQLPTAQSTANDFRDLFTVFHSESRIQSKDPFFHNANSAIRKSVWKQVPFSNYATNIEDRIWGKEVIDLGYKLYYNSDATVFHPHGINHNANQERALRVVEVCKNEKLYNHSYDEEWFVTK